MRKEGYENRCSVVCEKNINIADLFRSEIKTLLANTVAFLSINYHIQILVFTKYSTKTVLAEHPLVEKRIGYWFIFVFMILKICKILMNKLLKYEKIGETFNKLFLIH